MNKSVWRKKIANGSNLMSKIFTIFIISQALKVRRKIYEEPYAMDTPLRSIEE